MKNATHSSNTISDQTNTTLGAGLGAVIISYACSMCVQLYNPLSVCRCRFDFVAAPSSPGRGHRTPPVGWSGNVWVTRARTVTGRSAYKSDAGTVRHCHYLTGALRSGATLTTILVSTTWLLCHRRTLPF